MVFHIASYFAGSKVYKNLTSALDKLHVQQQVYVPVRNEGDVGRNNVAFEVAGSEVIYRKILSLYTRINFLHKIRRTVDDIGAVQDFGRVEIIHAHTLYSDGAAALALYKKYGTPYVVTVRSTDTGVFFKYFIHLRKLGREVLLNAKKIIFLSPTYKDRLLLHPYFDSCRELLDQKSLCIPNGIDSFWLNNLYHKKTHLQSPPELLYVGELIKRKKVVHLMAAVEQLNKEGLPCRLHIAGDNGPFEALVKKTAVKNPQWLRYYGRIEDREELKALYRRCDVFVMPSVNETFGLVYIEALSQGLPVIYTAHEGIDGYVNGNAGEALAKVDIGSIIRAIKNIFNNYDCYNFEPAGITAMFNWDAIAGIWLEIYNTSK